MRHRHIHEEFTLQQFRKRFESLSGQSVSFDYLRSSQVYGFFMHGRLVADFSFRTQPSLRHFQLLDEAGVSIDGLRSREHEFCELACLWIMPQLRSPVFRLNFYLTCVADALATGRAFIIGGSPVADIVPTQQLCLPYTLYQGAIAEYGEQPWSIYYGTRWTCLKGVARQVPGRVKDIVGAIPGSYRLRR